MYPIFLYNWQVRDEWFERLAELPADELAAERTGGVGSFLKTLFHILDVEYSWVRGAEGFDDPEPQYEDYASLAALRRLSDNCRVYLRPILASMDAERERKTVKVPWDEESYLYGEVLRHIAAHEIHHIGQLSIWARESGLQPVSAAFVGRNLSVFIR